MKHLIFIVITLLLLTCCKTAENLTLVREDLNNKNGNLRIDGYYYHQLRDVYHPFVLFENGVFLSCGYLDEIENIQAMDFAIQDERFIGALKRTQYGWGVFKLIGSEIRIERWLPGTGGPYPTQLLSGRILNDTTIAISGLRGRKYAQKIDTFRFRHLSPKPDSTNMFIN